MYFGICIAITFLVFFGTMVIGGLIGPGGNEIGYVVVALSIISGLIVACTCAIIDTIKNHKTN